MNDEEVAFRVVRLYFEEIARLGFKRQLDLDQILNAYFYALKRLDNKDVEMKKIVQKIVKEEVEKQEVEKKESNQDVPKEVLTKTTTTTIQTNNTTNAIKEKEKTITDILEGK
jgi:demethoxyubiquinone hydroxylase (CLK1/Coq7/Cat5 family)